MNHDVKFWLLLNGVPEGPYSVAYIQLHLATGKLTATTLACRDGNEEWRPLNFWLKSSPAPPELTPRQATSRAEECSTLLGIKPAAVLNAVCNYAIYVSPALFLAGHACCLWTPSPFNQSSPYFGVELLLLFGEAVISLLVTIVLFVAGIQLRRQKHVGVKLLHVGFSLNALGALGYITMSAFLGLLAGADSEAAHFRPDESISLSNVVFVAALSLVGIAAGIFQIAVWIWLIVNSSVLPIERSSAPSPSRTMS